MSTSNAPSDLTVINIPLERDVFMRTLIRELSGTLQDVVGQEEASGFISVVGLRMGDQIDRDHRSRTRTLPCCGSPQRTGQRNVIAAS